MSGRYSHWRPVPYKRAVGRNTHSQSRSAAPLEGPLPAASDQHVCTSTSPIARQAQRVIKSASLYNTYKPFSLFWDILFFKEGKRKTILLNRFTGLNIINVFFCASRISIHRIWGALEVEWKMEPFGYFFMYFPSMKWGSPLISEQCELNEVWQCEVYQVRIVEVKSNSGTWSLTWSTVLIQRNWLAILTYKFASCAETKWTSFFPLTLKFKNDF